MSLWKREFPDFVGEVKELEGFVDSSWHNDQSPSISFWLDVDNDHRIVVWFIDEREVEWEGCRYMVQGPIPEDGITHTCNTWDEVLALDLFNTFQFWTR